MKALLNLDQRRIDRWRMVAGSTYGHWLADNERASNRAAALVFVLGAPLAVAIVVVPLLIPLAWASVILIGAILAVGVAAFWAVRSRRGDKLPLRIANDLWQRGFPVVGLPPVFQSRDFMVWVVRNGATPDQLEAAALAPIVREPPQRTPGARPVNLKWSRGFGLAAVGLVAASAVSNAVLIILGSLTTGWVGGLGSNREILGPMLLAIGAVFGGVVVSYSVFLATRGSRVVRSVTTWLTVFFVVFAIAALFSTPLASWLAVIGAALWVACIALLWSPLANAYIQATDDINRALRDAVAERRSSIAG